MAFHNDPGGYRAMEPLDDRILDNPYHRNATNLTDGLYYRTDIPIDFPTLEATLADVDAPSTIQDYQYWAETAWKSEHGTYSAFERFEGKLREEVVELMDAVKLFENGDQICEEFRSELIKECGDVLWCATAIACCAGSDINSGLKNLLFQYVMGTQHFDNGITLEPRWREKAATLATKYNQLELTDINAAVDEGFEPLVSPMMNIYDIDEYEGSIGDHINTLTMYCLRLINSTKEQFGRTEEEDLSVFSSYFTEQARMAGEIVGQIYFELAFIADRTVGASLSDIVAENVAKLTQRIISHTIDKADGERKS